MAFPKADFVIEGYVDPREPLRDEGPFGDHTGYTTLPEPYPVLLRMLIARILAEMKLLKHSTTEPNSPSI